ncbi:MAG: GTP-binding protein [Bacteroidia bacterium]|nr:GTP-binding protein [Bacteroidia bacterium]
MYESSGKDLLRLLTCGSVDDGKSTLIGRLLYDTGAVYDDQLEAIARATQAGSQTPNLAILTDGLKAEREQGITIDVAYKYFTTERRKFILADAPGHVQYTRNMVTAASNASLAIVLIDARHGVTEQTRRHTLLCALLKLPHLVVAVNKMDFVDYSQARFEEIVADFTDLGLPARFHDTAFLPISALHGDTIVHNSPANLPWYQGPPLLEYLETLPLTSDDDLLRARLPVQGVVRPQTPAHPDYRGYTGRVASGVFKVGDRVTVYPSGLASTLTRIHTHTQELAAAHPQESVSVCLADELDISRGDLLVGSGPAPVVSAMPTATLFWLAEQPLAVGGSYLLQHHSRRVPCRVVGITARYDIATLAEHPAESLALNDIGQVRLQLAEPLAYDPYPVNRALGAAILIDPRTLATVAGVLLLPPEAEA